MLVENWVVRLSEVEAHVSIGTPSLRMTKKQTKMKKIRVNPRLRFSGSVSSAYFKQ